MELELNATYRLSNLESVTNNFFKGGVEFKETTQQYQSTMNNVLRLQSPILGLRGSWEGYCCRFLGQKVLHGKEPENLCLLVNKCVQRMVQYGYVGSSKTSCHFPTQKFLYKF